MDNKLKSKTRLAFIQYIFLSISSHDDNSDIKNDFDNYFHNLTVAAIDETKDTKIQYNKNMFNKLTDNYIDFIKLKKIIDESKFSFEQIESFYYFPSNRWDIKTKDGFLIKLPEKNIAESLKFAAIIKINEKFKDKKIIDLRISNNIVLSNE